MSIDDIDNIIKSALSQNPVNNDESICILPANNNAKYIEYSKIHKKRKDINSDVSSWVTSNFVSYAKILHKSIFKIDWVLNFSPQCNAVLKVKDKLLEIFGYCDNFLLKEYLDWFFTHMIFDYVGNGKTFYFGLMLKDDPLNQFFIFKDGENIVNKTNISLEAKVVDVSEIKNAMALSEKRALMDYGIVITFNFFINYYNMGFVEALSKIYNMLNKDENVLNFALQSTCKFSPYPVEFKMEEIEEILSKYTFGPNMQTVLSLVKFDVKENYFCKNW